MNLGDAPAPAPGVEGGAVEPTAAPDVISNPITNIFSSILGRRRLQQQGAAPAPAPVSGLPPPACPPPLQLNPRRLPCLWAQHLCLLG